MKRKLFQFLSLLMLMLYSTSAWAAEKTVTADLSKWTVDKGDGGSVTVADGIAAVTLGSTKGNAVTLTSDQTYTGITKVELTLQTSDRSKETVAINVGSESFESSYDETAKVLSIGTVSISSNGKDATGSVTPTSAQDGSVVITIAQASGSGGKTAVVKDVKITYTTEDSGKTVVSQALNGVKIGSTALDASKYTVSDNVITLTDEYALNAPAVKLVNKITYSDDSTEDEDVAVEGFAYSDGFFAGKATIGATTYTVKVPAKAISTTLADVTASTTWDWSKTGSTAVQLTDATYPSKSTEFVLSNLISSTENFNSDALKVQTEYAVRDGKYMQGGKVTFHTTVPGTIKVSFSNTGDRKGDETLTRYLYVNGVKTTFGSNNGTAITTDEIEVEAGDVVLTSKMSSSEADQYIRIYSIVFTVASQGGEEPGGDDIDPSTAKLLWDYTEAAPTGSPDNGLTYYQNVNDATGTKNGLKGVKMNSSGYAYFTKAAVKGTLKLTFGPRDGNSEIKLGVYSFASEPKAETLIEKTTGVTELQTISIDLTAVQNNIYINRAEGAEGVLTKVEFVPFIPRTFQDFEMVLGGLSSEYDASQLPEGVTFSGTYNNDSHGYRNAVVTVPVDGTVKFTYSSCTYGNQKFSVKNDKGEIVASDLELTLGQNTCYHQNPATNVLTYIYTGEPTTLTFGPIQYLAYFKAEACEVSPCKVTYKDQNGNVIKTINTFEGEALGELPSAEGITVPEGSVFRGWFYASGAKAKATDIVKGNTTITAKVTPIETVAVGSVQTYNLASNIFYPEDHETISIEGGYWHDGQHGWAIATGGKVSVDVAGNAQVILGLCKYSKDAAIKVTDAEGNVVTTIASAYNENDGALATVQYAGPATTLTFTFAQGESYLHKITVYNVQEFLEKDANTGWYIVPAGDAAALMLALNSANAETAATIFLPNGTYDLGEATGTTISGNNMSIIGESMDGTIIKNAPNVKSEGLGSADLFYNTSTGLYMQDLTLQNDLDYYAAGAAGRAAVLQDNGTRTILRNVAMRSYQDTYYSKSGNYYFEGGLIQGTVDYICGGGNAFFENITLLNKSRKKDVKNGDDTMTAYNGTGKYIFNNCSVESECETFNFGRSWGEAYVVYLNTTIKSGKLIDTRFSTADMNSKPRFYGEYNTVDESGNGKNTPASNVIKTSLGAEFESVLTAEKAATYTLASLFGTWSPKAIAEQAEADANDIASDVLYLVESDGKFETIAKGYALDLTALVGKTIRKANSRGGFGEPTVVGETDAINLNEYVSAQRIAKVYDITGREVNAPAKGVYIIDGKKYIK